MSLTTASQEMVLQGIRSWLKACSTSSGAPLTDAQIIPSDDDGPRPPMPYLTVRFTAVDVPVGEDEPVVFLADVVTVLPAASGHLYELTVNGTTCSYERTDDDDESTVATALAAAVNAAGDFLWADASSNVLLVASLHDEVTTATADAALTVQAAEAPLAGVLAQRMANLSVQAFGATAAEWLERATMRLNQPSAQELLNDAGLTVTSTGGRTNLSAVLDTGFESRFLREFEVAYALRAEPESVTAFGLLGVTITLRRYSSDPDPYSITLADAE